MNDQVTNIVHHGAVNACSGEVWVALSTWGIGFSTKQTLQGVGIREEEQEMLGRGVGEIITLTIGLSAVVGLGFQDMYLLHNFIKT